MRRPALRILDPLRWPRIPPPAVLALFYLALIVIGAGLLILPASHDGSIGLREALFTSTSAVTVTGLALVDTGTAFTPFGQAVILGLIQLGGLGLMTFAVLVFLALGIPVGMPHRLILREDLNQTSISKLTHLARHVLKVSLLCELAGTVVLCLVFVPDFGLAGLWQALFHAVSAFNNAGFSLFADSLSGYVGSPIINLAIPALFLTGGIGFIVLADLHEKRRWRRLTLHSKLMLFGTLILTIWGALMVGLLEWNNPATLGALPLPERLWAAWFQGVTPRTAGFNTVDISGMHDSTALVTMLLMLVGAGPTSTAGGIKVTTLFVLILATVAFFRRQQSLHAFGRSLGLEEVLKVMALTTLSLLLVLSGIFLISISHDGDFLDLTFEVTSAFGTVGLSRGATGMLDGFGLAVIMAIMFVGRVGPLTIGFFLATRSTPRVQYPAGQVYLG